MSNTHFLNPFFIYTHFRENLFKYFAQGEGEKPDGSQMQTVAHLVQDRTRLPVEDVHGLEGFLGKLEGQTAGETSEKEPELPHSDQHGRLQMRRKWCVLALNGQFIFQHNRSR